MPPWGVSQGGYLRGSVLHVCAVSACAQFVRSTLSVSRGAMHVDDDLFRARGTLRVGCPSARRGVDTPHPNPKGRRTPTARCLHTHFLHHRPMRPLFHQPFRGGRTTKDPGAPLLSAVCVSPSPLHSPGSGAAKIRKTPRLPARMGNYLRQMSKTTCRKSLHLAGTPQLGKCRENGRPSETATNSTKSAKSARGQTSEDRGPGRSEANRIHHEPEQQPPTEPTGGDEEHHEPVACNNEHTKDKRHEQGNTTPYRRGGQRATKTRTVGPRRITA